MGGGWVIGWVIGWMGDRVIGWMWVASVRWEGVENRFREGGLAGSEKAWVLGWGWDFPVLGEPGNGD